MDRDTHVGGSVRRAAGAKVRAAPQPPVPEEPTPPPPISANLAAGTAGTGTFFEAFRRDGNDANLEIAREENGGNSASELIQFPVISNKICKKSTINGMS